MNDQAPSAAERLKAPAICLLIYGVISVLGGLWNILGSIIGQQLMRGITERLAAEGQNVPPFFQLFLGANTVFNIVSGVVIAALGAWTIYVSLQMQKLRGHGAAMGAAIVAMVPCLSGCCCIGIPIGIWILIVLNRPDVRSAFQANDAA